MIPVEGKDNAPVDDLFGDAVRQWPRECGSRSSWWPRRRVRGVRQGQPLQRRAGGHHRVDLVLRLLQAPLGRPRQVQPHLHIPRRCPPSPPGPSPVVQYQYPGPPTAFTERPPRGSAGCTSTTCRSWRRRCLRRAPGRPRPLPRRTRPVYKILRPSPATPFSPRRPRRSMPSRTWSRRCARRPPPGPSALGQAAPVGRPADLGAESVRSGIVDYLGRGDPGQRVRRRRPPGHGITLVAATWLGRALRASPPLGVLLAGAVLVLSALGPQSVGLPMPPMPARQVVHQSVADSPPGGDALDFGTCRSTSAISR